MARHDVVRPRRELRALPRGPEEGRAEPAAAGERRGHRRHVRARPRRLGGGARRTGGRGGAPATRRRRPTDTAQRRRHRGRSRAARPSPCRSTSTACSSASSRCPACRRASTRKLKAGVAGTVYYLETGGGADDAGGAGGSTHRPLSPERSARGDVRDERRRLRRQRRRPQAALSHARRRRRTRRRRAAAARAGRSRAVPRRRRSQAADGRAGPAQRHAADVSRAEGGVQADLQAKAGATSATTSTCRTCTAPTGTDEGDVRRAAAVREPSRRPQLPARQHGRRDRDRPLVRARRRHAGRAARRPAGCSAPTSRSRAAATRSRASTTTRAGIPICARRSRRPASTSTVGDFILAINGVELKAPDNIYRLLDGTANRQTVLDGEQPAGARRRAPGDGGAGRERAGAAHARVGRRQPPARRQAVERPARLRLPAEHRAARLHELQPLLLRAAGQEGRGHRRALQRRRLGGRLHHRRACSATSTATSTTSPAIACRSPARRPASGDRR